MNDLLKYRFDDEKNPSKIEKYKILKMKNMEQLPSMIGECDNTYICGVCQSEEPPIIDKNKKNDNNIEMVCCDGPRNDYTESILCNQWYHKICINAHNGLYINKYDVFFGDV